MNASKIYTFTDLKYYPDFVQNVLENDKKETLPFKNFLNEKVTKNLGIELINKYFKSHCSDKGIWYNKDFNRYYFAKLKEDTIETEQKDNYEKKVIVLKKIEKLKEKL